MAAMLVYQDKIQIQAQKNFNINCDPQESGISSKIILFWKQLIVFHGRI